MLIYQHILSCAFFFYKNFTLLTPSSLFNLVQEGLRHVHMATLCPIDSFDSSPFGAPLTPRPF